MRPLIAVVDDNRDNRLLLELLLRDNYDVRTFCNAHDFIQVVHETRFAGVLTDLDLGDAESGTWLLQYIRENPQLRGLIVVAVSGYPPDFHTSSKHRFDAHLMKPVEEQTMLNVIGSLLHAVGTAA
jgi:CheY-like chemotaxis protein